MSKTYKDNPNKWRKHSDKNQKPWKQQGKPKQEKPDRLESFDEA